MSQKNGEKTNNSKNIWDNPKLPNIVALPITPRRKEDLSDGLSRIAHLCRLDIYGSDNLDRAAKNTMGFAAVILCIVFIFDLLMWSLLFNVILSGGWMEYKPYTIIAILLGAMFSIATFIYERQFLTDDSATPLHKRIFPYSIRICLIIGAGLITSQPFELLLFKGPVAARLHQEDIRVESVNRYYELQKNKNFEDLSQENIKDHISQIVYDGFDEKKQNLKQVSDVLDDNNQLILSKKSYLARLRNEKNEKIIGIESVEKDIAEYESIIKDMQEKLGTLEQDSVESMNLNADILINRNARISLYKNKNLLESKIRWYEKETIKTEGDIENLENMIPTLTADQTRLLAETEQAENEVINKEEQVLNEFKKIREIRVSSQQRCRDWIATLTKATPGEKVFEFGNSLETNKHELYGQGFSFDPPAHDFFMQLRVLRDLRYGTAPKWPEIPKDLRYKIIEDFQGLNETLDENEIQRMIGDSRSFNYSYWLVFGVSLFLPILIFIYKLIYPKNLVLYYNSDYHKSRNQVLKVPLQPFKIDMTRDFENSEHISNQGSEDNENRAAND